MSEKETQMILGVDFDNTLFLNSFPDNYTEPNWPVINYVKQKMADGWFVILVTCRTDSDNLQGAIEAAKNYGIVFDAVNSNHPDLIAKWGDCRKIYCDEYIDDKNHSLSEIVTQETKPKIVYIAGKMRGLKDYGRRHFYTSARCLETQGYIVLDPSTLPLGMPNEKYMPICLSMLEAADYIYMLDNWEDSEGAKIEYSYAVIQGKQVLFEKDESVERINNGFKENNQINRAV